MATKEAAINLCFICCLYVGVYAQLRDLTLEPDTSGSDVVRAAVAKVLTASRNQTRIFGNRLNYWLLRRIAYVETRDGTDADTYSDANYHGGIWRVSEEVFNCIATDSRVRDYRAAVETAFDIRLDETFSWRELRKPLYSALATALNLVANQNDSKCLRSNTMEQAICWLIHHKLRFPGHGGVTAYQNAVDTLDSECRTSADVSFILDSSGSIGVDNYQTVKEFVYNFTEVLDIEPDRNRVSVTIFGNTGSVVFGFDQYNNKTALLEAIEGVPYLRQWTNTADGLCKVMNNVLTNSSQLRLLSVFKLVIVLTDGRSNRISSECGNISQAAATFCRFAQDNSVLVYVVGVTNRVNMKELELIATSPEYITHLDSFDNTDLDSTQQLQAYELCFTASASRRVGGISNAVVGNGERIRLTFPLPVEGVTVRLCVSHGQLVLYASVSSTAPNSAVHDWMSEIAIGCGDIFIDPRDVRNDNIGSNQSQSDLVPDTNNDCHRWDSTMDEYADLTLYVSIEGVEETNSFVFQTTTGDTSIPVFPVVTGNHTVGELGRISLQCSYAGGPQSMVVWLKRSEEDVRIVLNSSRVLVTHQRQTSGDVHVVTSNLTVHNVSTVDGGEYLCEATNGQVSNTVTNYINVTARNECTSDRFYPCQHGGTCVDLVGRYECLCTSMYTGVNCSERVDVTRTTEPSITRPPQGISAQLAQSINLTCEAESYPAPAYKWYKDGELIPQEILPYLYIPEASPGDRGSYSCEANNPRGQASSNLAQIVIPGVYQYRIQWNQTSTTNAEDLLGELLGIVGTTLSMNSSASIYSIQVLNGTSSSSQGGEATYIFTVRWPPNEGTSPVLVRRSLYELLQSFGKFQVVEITRYDGCPAETTTLNTDDISHPYSWPEAEIGTTLFQSCPCEDIVGSQSGNTSRQCAGTYSNGGSWSQADYTQCAILSSEVTRRLCASALGLSNPLNVSREVAALTTENLTPTDVSAATFIVEQLTQEAVRNSQVTQNYLQIVDNLQLADDETLLSSQTETNSSSRLLSSLATFSDEVEVSPNTSTRRTIYAFQNFALQVQDANLTAFAGETFSVDLGSVEEAMNNTHTINQSALVTMMAALSHATASAQIPNSVFDSCGNQGALTNQIYDRANRLSYTVFRRSGLFQTSNTNNVQSSNGNDFFLLGNTNNSIGSIILGVRRRCAQNFSPLSSHGSKRTPREAPLKGSLEIPVQLQFRISQIMQEGSKSSNCVHWDATQNGGFGAWSPEGCSEVFTGSGNEKVCECTQLAHFGILFDLNPKPPPPAVALALSVLTYVGLSISLLCLFALLVTYLSSKKLRTSIHGQVLINLSLSLMGLYIFFLTGAHLTYIPVLCGISSALLHYFMLVFFGWTTAEAVLLYVKLVIIIGTQKIESRFILKAALGTWLVPLLIVAVSAGAGHDYYANPFYCRATEWPFWFGLILPFVLLYIINWVMFVIILVSVIKHNTAHSKDAGLRKLFKRNFVIAVGLAIVFGLGWGLGLMATSSSEEGVTLAFQIVFTIFVALQGLLLFAFHGIRNKDARQLWKEWCYAACVKSYKAYSASRSVAVSSVAGKGATMPSSISTDSAEFSTLGRQGAAKVKSVESENQAETSLDMSSCDTVLVTENPAYGEVQKQQQGTQQASPRYVEGQLDQEHHHEYETAKTEVPPARRRSRKRSWLQSIVSSGKIDYQEIVSTPPPERKEFSSSAEGTGITDQPTDNSDEATAQPRKPRKSWITPFTSQSHIYEVLPESAENPPSKSRKKVSTSKLPKRGEHGTDDRQQEPIILEDEAEDEAQ